MHRVRQGVPRPVARLSHGNPVPTGSGSVVDLRAKDEGDRRSSLGVRMYERLLLTVDGSSEARNAAEFGLRLASAFDATVTILHVVEQKALGLTETLEERERLRNRGEEVVAAVAERATTLGLQAETVVAEGRPVEEIDARATQYATDLVVVGRQGLTGLGRRLLGGVTEQLLHRSDVPVVVVPDGPPGADPPEGVSQLLVPTDGSENAEAAAPHARAIAAQYGSTVHVLSVVDLQAAGGVFDAGGLEKAFVERLEAQGKTATDRLAAKIGDSTALEVQTAVELMTSFDGVGAGITAYVEEHDIEFVVMGSHGRSNLERQLLGSVASTVLRTIDVPVLVVTRGQEASGS